MKAQVLVNNSKYQGKYVALQSFVNNTVVASGDNPSAVLERAHQKGATRAVLVFVHPKDTVHIF